VHRKCIGSTAQGIGNIFKVLRIDFAWRGNYLNTPDTNRFTVKGSFDLLWNSPYQLGKKVSDSVSITKKELLITTSN
jgi:hypothetical protein